MFTALGAAAFAPAPTAYMAADVGWPSLKPTPADASGPTGLIPLGVENWQRAPHRLGFLGRPILDCGHGANRLEIHPPHVLTMDLAEITVGRARGMAVGAFGWANITMGNVLEFDLWPPARPSARAKLVVRDLREVQASAAGAEGPVDWGWVIDVAEGMRWRSGASAPTMECVAAPAKSPNHVHCVYRDPAAGPPPPDVDVDVLMASRSEGQRYANPRMTPTFATSRFDLRIFLGWEEPF